MKLVHLLSWRFGRRWWLAACMCVLAGLGSGASANGSSDVVALHPEFKLAAKEASGTVWTSGPFALLTLGSPNTSENSRSVVIDDSTGTRREFSTSACTHSAIGTPWILFGCVGGGTDGLRFYDMATGKWTPLICNSNACALALQHTDSYQVGSRWVAFIQGGHQSCGPDAPPDCGPPTYVYYNRRTRRLRYSRPQSNTTLLDLDSQTLTRSLCRPLRIPPGGSLTFYGEFAVASAGNTSTLERCGSHLAIPIGQREKFITGTLGAPRAVFWPVVDSQGAWHGQIDGRLLPSLRRFTITLPASIPVCEPSGGSATWPFSGCTPTIAATSEDLYVVDVHRHVWRATFPPGSNTPRR